MKARIRGAETVQTRGRRQYHIGLAPGEVAPRILLAGDPDRARRASRHLHVRLRRENREFVSLTGTYKGIDVTVMSTGIGPDNTEIALVELGQIVKAPVLIRTGSCGALHRRIRCGDLVVSTAAVRLENTSTYFVPEGYPAVAHYEVVQALVDACGGRRTHVGLTASTPGFYGAQGRDVPGFPPRWPDLSERLARLNVLNFEMETSVLFTLSALRGWRAGAVCAVFANRSTHVFIRPEQKSHAEDRLTEIGLQAIIARTLNPAR